MRTTNLWKAFALTLLLMACGREALAQQAQLTGRITDNSDAVVAGAVVKITNLDTGITQQTETNSDGLFTVPFLPPGNYRVTIEARGFKTATRDGLKLNVDQVARTDFALEPGALTETVQVTSDTPLLQTETTSLSQVVEGRAVNEMPLNGRNVLNLVALVPGVVPQGSSSGNPMGNQAGGGTTNPNGWGNYQIGGGMANQSATFLDGSPLNVSYVNSTVLVPTQDAIQEFRVATNAVSAEFGRFAGGVVNLTSRGGTNQFHGAAYEYLRNRSLNANNFFNNRSGLPRPPLVQNQYGANISGPVRKEKTFFFFSYEGFKYRQGIPVLTTVPTAAMRNGDFSAAGLSRIYDPLTVCGRYNNPACATDASGNPIYVRQPFADNKIPANRIDATANILKNFWAPPNLPGFVNNFATNSRVGGDQYQINARADHNISERQRLFGRYTRWIGNTIPNDPFQNKTAGVSAYYRAQQVVIGDTYTFSNSTVGDFRVSYLRFPFGFTPPSTGADLAQFGPAFAALQNQVTFRQFPAPVVTGLFGFGGIGTTVRNVNNVYSFSGNVTRTANRHTLKFGGELRNIQWNYGQTNTASGSFSFDNRFTAQNPLAPGATGYPFASFLLGFAASGSATEINLVGQRQRYRALYFADTFQATTKLTLNYGVRWDYPGEFFEARDRATVLLPDAPDALSQKTGLQLKGQLALVNSETYKERTIHPNKKNLFAPRAGLALRWNDKTVARLGYGLSYLPSDVAFLNAPWFSSINSALTAMVATVDGGITPANTLSNPFPTGVLQPAGRNPGFLSTLEGFSPSSPIADVPYPYTQQWNFNIERELAGGVMVEAGYGGSKGTHLPIALTAQLNQLPNDKNALGSALLAQAPNPFFGHLPTSSLLGRATISQGQLLRPFPQYQSLTNTAATVGNSTYHSLQTKFEKRFKAGGALLVAYTWAKLLSDTDTLTPWLEPTQTAGGVQNWHDLRAEKSLASYDVAHRAVISYVLDLPFGKGKKFLSGVTGVADKLVSGWGLNGITTFQSGFPLFFSALPTTLSTTFGAGAPRPVYVAGCNKEVSGRPQDRLGRWFNTACFTAPNTFGFGTESRTDPDLRGHGVNNYDISLSKTTAITEQARVQFRAEFFNIFNRTQFSTPGLQQGNPTFGVVTAVRNQPRLVQFALRLQF
jgi:hypothetical protein